MEQRNDGQAREAVSSDRGDAEVRRLRNELDRARRQAASARAEAAEARRAFSELATASRKFASSISERAIERKLTRRRLRMQYEVSRVLSGPASLQESAPSIFEVLEEWLGWEGFTLWEVESGSLRRASDGTRLRRGEGLAGRVWAEGRVLWEESPDDAGGGALAFPVQGGSDTPAVVECRADSGFPPDSDLLAAISLVGTQLGQAVERWRAEEERDRSLSMERRAREELSGILESISDAFFALDAERRFTYVNREAERVWGRGRGELLGREIWEVFPGTVGSEPYGALERALERGVVGEFESFSTALGAWMSGRVYPRVGGGVSVYFRDVTGRKQTEEALRRAAEADAFRVKLADALRPLTDPVGIQAETTRLLGEQLGANGVHYAEIEEDGEGVVIARDYANGIPSLVGRHRLSSFGATLAREIRAGRTFVSSDDVAAEGSIGGLGSHVSVPLIKGGRLIAALSVYQAGPRAWTEYEVALVEETAERTWAAVERARAEEALRESEEWLRRAQRVAGAGTWEWRLKTGEIRWSAEHRELLGFDPEGEVTREDWWEDAVHPDDVPLLEEAWERCEGGEEWIEVEYRVLKGGVPGEVRWLNARGQTVAGENGEPDRVLGISVDVTDRRAAEEALRESEERYRTLFETMDEGFCVVDLIFDADGEPVDYRFVEMNPAFEKHTGLREAKGKTARELVPDLEAHWFEIYGRVALTGEPARFVNRAAPMEDRWFDVYAFRPDERESQRVAILFTDITERKRAEEASRRSEERLRLLIESARDYAILTTTPDNIIDSWSTGAEKIFGYTESEIIGQSGAVLFTPEDREQKAPEREIQTTLTQGRALDERWHVRKDGSRFFASGVMAPLSDGGLHGFVKIARDLTERKEAEERRHESEERYRTLISNFPGAIYRCEWREEPMMVFVSDRIEEITGYPKEDFLENRVRSYGSLIFPEDRARLDEQVMGALMRGEPYALEYRIRHADGGVRWINERGNGFFSEEGELLHLDGAIFDVTERKEARIALRESEERLRAVVENAPIVLCAMDREGVFQLAEGRGHATLGVAPGSMVGRSAFEVFRDNPDVLEDTRRALAGEAFTIVREVKGALWETTYTPLRDGTGRPAGAIAVATDVTVRKKVEEERNRLRAREWVARAEAGERERISRELHDRVAHQMGVVHQSLELYRALSGPSPERAIERLDLAREMAKAALDATRNLSAELRRSEAEEGLESALADLLDAFESPSFGTKLSVQGDEELLPPHVRGQVFIILREAVRNAARHSGGEGVSVSVEITPEEVVGRVEDEGMGFEGEGTKEGRMGLRSMRERAALLGGTLRIESGEGSGTKVEVRAPLNGVSDGRDDVV